MIFCMPPIIWSQRLAGTPNTSLGRFFTLPSGPIFLTSVTNRSLEIDILYLVFKYCHIERYCKSFTDPVISFRMQKQPRRCSVRKGVLRSFKKFYRKHLCQNLFLNKVAGLRLATLLKKKLCHRCFPVNFQKFLRMPFLQNTSERLFLRMTTLNAISSLLEIFLSSYFSNFLSVF